MHDCLECGEACDCDGEDHYNAAAAENCVHACDPEDDFEIFPEDYLVTGDAAQESAICRGCGCSAFNPCPGGCVWATESLCSRCVKVSV